MLQLCFLLLSASVAAGAENAYDATARMSDETDETAMLQSSIGMRKVGISTESQSAEEKLKTGIVDAPLMNLKEGDVNVTVMGATKLDPCTVHAEAHTGPGSPKMVININRHKLHIEKVTGGKESTFYRDSVQEGEEIITVEDAFFVEAEHNHDAEEKPIGLVHVGAELNHGGAEWLKNRSKSVDTDAVFKTHISTLLKDPAVNTVILSSLALMKAGFDAKKYFCTRPFHMFAMQIAKAEAVAIHPMTHTALISFFAVDGTNTSVLHTPSYQAFNASQPRRPYKDCESNYLGQCGLPGQCWEKASGCEGCGCMRGCEYHDHWCSCGSMLHHVCWRMSFGGWEQCGKCVGPTERMNDNTRRRRFW